MIGTIERFDLYEVAVPLQEPHVTAAGSLTERRVILVAATAGGITGWGECGPIPGYFGSGLDACWASLEQAARAITAALGGNVTLTFSHPSGVAFGQALDDLAARTAAVPLWRHLDGHRNRVVAGAVAGLGTVDETLARVDGLVAAGYRHVKVKITPGHDMERLTAIDRRFPGLSLAADGNGSYSSDDRSGLARCNDLTLAFLEQPFPAGDLAGHVSLAAELTAPICLDESTDEHGWLEAARRPFSGLAATVKPARMSRDQLERLLADPDVGSRIRLRVGGMLETGVGRAHAFAAASRDVFTLPTDLSPPPAYLAADVVEWDWPFVGGEVHLPASPGIGLEVDPGLLSAVTVRHATIP